jgi:hypothetical protein
MQVGASVERERRPCMSGLHLHPAQGVRALAICAPAALSRIAYGADTIVFGPHTYQRATGAPVTVQNSFSVQNPSGSYTLRDVNQGVTSAVISPRAMLRGSTK